YSDAPVPGASATPGQPASHVSASVGSSGDAIAASGGRSGRVASIPSIWMRPEAAPRAAVPVAHTTAGTGGTPRATTARRRPPPPVTVTARSRSGRTGPNGPATSAALQPGGAVTMPSSLVPATPSGPASSLAKSHPAGKPVVTRARHASAATS